MPLADPRQHLAAGAARPGKPLLPERTVGHHRDLLRLAVRNQLPLDPPLQQVIQHLVAGQPLAAQRPLGLAHLIDVEIAHADEAHFAGRYQFFHRPHGLGDADAVPASAAGIDRAASVFSRSRLRSQAAMVPL